MPNPKSTSSRYGIGEWYGKNINELSNDQRSHFASINKIKTLPCPFKSHRTLCNKPGGVCTLTSYKMQHRPEEPPIISADTSNLVTTCPNRFWQNNFVFSEISKDLLNTEKPVLIPEVGFLQGINSEGRELTETVGRLDLILANVSEDKDIINWCVLEMQAVYFSGASMKRDFNMIKDSNGNIVFPTGIRRPDFRSSGPKRLMPQLQIKIPTLRRWGKKMAIVIDFCFFKSMAPMDKVSDISNADILWIIVDYDSLNQIYIKEKVYTTLESSVKGLTAGIPIALTRFEEKLKSSIDNGFKIINI